MTTSNFKYLAGLPPDPSRPLWSVMIPTFNCAPYLEEVLKCVLEQDPGPAVMQICVVDDYSTDNPQEVVDRVGKGRVDFFQQPSNQGHTHNFETCLEKSRGRLVHLLHGDDRILPGFYKTMETVFATHPDLGAAFCRNYVIDETGNRVGLSKLRQDYQGIFTYFSREISYGQLLQTPSMVVKREVYERIGMFDRTLLWCEDWEMWNRIGMQYPVAYIPEPLAEYREHSKSNTGRYIKTAENIQDQKRLFSIIIDRVPPPEKDHVRSRLFNESAIMALARAMQFVNNHRDYASACNQLREGIPLAITAKLRLKMSLYYLWFSVKRLVN